MSDVASTRPTMPRPPLLPGSGTGGSSDFASGSGPGSNQRSGVVVSGPSPADSAANGTFQEWR